MKLIPESIERTYFSHPNRAAQTGQRRAKSEPASLTRAPRTDQRRVFWLFIFSFSLVLVYGGCAKPTDLRPMRATAEGGTMAYAISGTQLKQSARHVSLGLVTRAQKQL
jgi:hypothetical protein